MYILCCQDPPRDVSGFPVPGFDGDFTFFKMHILTSHKNIWDVFDCLLNFPVMVLREDGSEAGVGELGRIVTKMPTPPGNFANFHNLHF